MQQERPRILLADDHEAVRQLVERMLGPDFEVVGSVCDGQALVDAAKSTACELIIADVDMPSLNGLDALQVLRRDQIDTPVLILTASGDHDLARAAHRRGAEGFVMKESMGRALIPAIHRLLDGGTYFPNLEDDEAAGNSSATA